MEQLGIHDETRRAFLAQPIDVFGIPIQPPVFAHMLLLSARAPHWEEGRLTQEEILEAAIIFATPGPDAAALFEWPAEEWQRARISMACRLPLAAGQEVLAAIGRQIAGAMAAHIAVEGTGQKKTDSAGGSPSQNAPPPNMDGASSGS